jgi:hypothetical protein
MPLGEQALQRQGVTHPDTASQVTVGIVTVKVWRGGPKSVVDDQGAATVSGKTLLTLRFSWSSFICASLL